MKISLMAFLKNMTVSELFLKTIYDTYHQRNNQGLILDPWPPVTKGVLKRILTSNNEEWKEEDDEADGGHIGILDKKTMRSEKHSLDKEVDKLTNPQNKSTKNQKQEKG